MVHRYTQRKDIDPTVKNLARTCQQMVGMSRKYEHHLITDSCLFAFVSSFLSRNILFRSFSQHEKRGCSKQL